MIINFQQKKTRDKVQYLDCSWGRNIAKDQRVPLCLKIWFNHSCWIVHDYRLAISHHTNDYVQISCKWFDHFKVSNCLDGHKSIAVHLRNQVSVSCKVFLWEIVINLFSDCFSECFTLWRKNVSRFCTKNRWQEQEILCNEITVWTASSVVMHTHLTLEWHPHGLYHPQEE
jgi:hypothetical protein